MPPFGCVELSDVIDILQEPFRGIRIGSQWSKIRPDRPIVDTPNIALRSPRKGIGTEWQIYNSSGRSGQRPALTRHRSVKIDLANEMGATQAHVNTSGSCVNVPPLHIVVSGRPIGVMHLELRLVSRAIWHRFREWAQPSTGDILRLNVREKCIGT